MITRDGTGIQLNKRAPIAVISTNGQNLNASALVVAEDTNVQAIHQSADWATQLAEEINPQEIDMLMLDHSVDGFNNMPSLIQVAYKNVVKTDVSTVGVCFLSTNAEKMDKNIQDQIDPMSAKAYGAFGLEFKDIYDRDGIINWYDNAQLQVVQKPTNGTLSGRDFFYRPNPGFVGNDKIIYLVSGQGPDGKPHSVKLVYYFKVVKDLISKLGYNNDNISDEIRAKKRLAYCAGRPETWLISEGQFNKDLVFGATQDSFSLAAWQRGADLSAILANASQSLTGFSDLASTAVGETTGEGLSAQITLDTNAAGHA